MLVLALVWLALLILELVRGLSPGLQTLGTVIWVIFALDFVGRLVLSLDRLAYVRHNWLTAVALLVPPLRVLRLLVFFRFVRVFTGLRALRVVRIFGSLNRGIRSLGGRLRRRGLIYVIVITVVMLLVLAAGIYSYEGPQQTGLVRNYGDSLWLTAIIITTLGPDTWPVTWEGRVLSLVAAIYGFAVFGYITAALASFLVGREAEQTDTTAETARLRESVDRLSRQLARMERRLGSEGEEGSGSEEAADGQGAGEPSG